MTLTEAGHWAKRFGVILSVILLFSIIIVYFILNSPSKKTTPSAEKATMSCPTAIPKLEIPSLQMGAGSSDKFKTDTPTGKIDKFPKIVNVYKYNNPGESLTFLSEAQIIAEKLGFSKEKYIRESTIAYIWDDLITARRLRIEAKNMLFELKTEFGNMQAMPKDKESLPTDTEAVSIATNFLKNTGLFTTDYADGEVKTTMIKIGSNGALTEATSKASADLIRVDFFRKAAVVTFLEDSSALKSVEKSLENFKYDVYTVEQDGVEYTVRTYFANIEQKYSQNGKSYLSVLVGPADRRKSAYGATNIYGVEYKNWIVELSACGTYPIIPAGTAVQMVSEGKGSLVYFNRKGGDDVVAYSPLVATDLTILDIDLGYYDVDVEAEYLQPIYIVKGEAILDNGDVGSFVYFVPAIDYEYIVAK